MIEKASTKSHLHLLIDLTKREFKVRYLGSVLGSYWNIIHPLIMILIYTIVFSKAMHARMGTSNAAGEYSYSIYLCTGLLAWNFLSEIVNRGTATLLDNASFMKKLAFPPIILFGATAFSAALNFIISFGIFLVALFFIKPPSLAMLLTYLAIVCLMIAFGLGLALALGCLNVFMRDFQQLTSITFQLWFWFTPIIYLADLLPQTAKDLLYFNPAYAFIEPLHDLLYFGRWPQLEFFGLMLLWVTLSLSIGLYVYKRAISRVRDML